uniref:Adenylate kinase 8 n=1 Tax=Scleropages formosus TaxID=113540 RepID=A0A8C9VX78_SCLFO
MDGAAERVRIPPEMALYAEKHEIFDLLQCMVRSLMVDKPEEPIEYLIELLSRGRTEVPRIMVLGPPASGKRTIAVQLCEHTKAVHITASNVLKEDTRLTREARHLRDIQKVRLWIKLIQQCLSKVDCIRQGWVLEGIPHTRQEALLLQEVGIFPEHVVMLEAPDEILIKRSLAKRMDPASEGKNLGPVSNKMAQGFLSEDDIASQLIKYHQEAHALQRTYKNCLKVVKSDQSQDEVFAQVLSHVQCKPRSMAPHTPRVLLFGPPGSGKSLQAALIAQKYNLVNICCGELLRAVSADETSMGELIKPYLASGEPVPDSMVLQIMTERLSRLDCTARGWVLHGFPRDIKQAKMLYEANFIPSRVFFLEVTDEVASEVVTLRAVDPITGERYHSLYKPAPSPEIEARLQHNPRDSEDRLRSQLKQYSASVPALKAMYPGALSINVDQDPHAVFETLESWLVQRVTTAGLDLHCKSL